MLGVQVCAPHGHLSAAPHLPPSWGRLVVDGLPVGEHRVGVQSTGDAVTGAPPELTADPVACTAVDGLWG